jgi:hypothetical protein
MDISVTKNTSWNKLPWNQFRSKVFGLQCRIYDAMLNKDIKKTLKLQKCLLNSSSAHYIAVKELTDRGEDSKVPGNDGKLLLTFREKLLFLLRIRTDLSQWKYSSYRKVKIITFNGTDSFLSIPNMEDRIVQFIWKLALEPAHEAIFSECSYGFRPGRTIWDMQKAILMQFKKFSKEARINLLKIDLTHYSRLIAHNFLITKLIFPSKYKTSLYQALKSGILDGILITFSYQYSLTNLSFLLLNIAFHGSEDLLISTNYSINKKAIICAFRYGPHILYIFSQNQDNISALIDGFFYPLGITLLHSDLIRFQQIYNFDFLGWYFVNKVTGKSTSYPNKPNWAIYKGEVKSILRSSFDTTNIRLEKIYRRTQKWYKYNHLCDSSKIRSQIYMLRHWCNRYLRLHTNMVKEERSRLLKQVFASQVHFNL